MSPQSAALRPLVIAAPASGCGKTTLTLGLLAALRRRGLKVAPFKVGPDFIDPGHHSAACGRISRNLDGWMCGEEVVRAAYARGCAGAEVALIEGVMGLFDGAAGATDQGSTAEVARWLAGRILLLVDARAQARSAAALVKGFVEFDPRLQFAGVIFNRVGSSAHAQMLREAVASVPGLPPVLGCLPRESRIELPERHLGLVTSAEVQADFAALADHVEEHLDLASLVSAAAEPGAEIAILPVSRRVRLGVARDAAFCFCYPENLEALEAAGAELLFFSPLAEALPENLDGLYLPGGYPELYLERLSNNRALLKELTAAAEAGLPIYAECGGLLLLCAGLNDQPLCGIFPAWARLLDQRKALGYREVCFSRDTPLGLRGTIARGHEFHYSELEMPAFIERSYRLSRKCGAGLPPEGFRYKNVLASYMHLHFGSNPQLAINFVNFCERQRSRQRGTEVTENK
jgi:cobyrinic acid a,c-diamide synthase